MPKRSHLIITSRRLGSPFCSRISCEAVLNYGRFIYQVEKNPAYSALVDTVFQEVDAGRVGAVTSPVTLAECLVHPYESAAAARLQAFTALITAGRNTQFVMIDQDIAQKAAELRTRYNLLLLDDLTL